MAANTAFGATRLLPLIDRPTPKTKQLAAFKLVQMFYAVGTMLIALVLFLGNPSTANTALLVITVELLVTSEYIINQTQFIPLATRRLQQAPSRITTESHLRLVVFVYGLPLFLPFLIIYLLSRTS